MGNNETTVREFLAAWSKDDPGALADYFTDDAVFQMMPRGEEVTGREAIHNDFKTQLEWVKDCDFEVKAVSSSGPIVFAERIDRMKVAGAPIAIAVVGVFEFAADGKMTAWRDYFDMTQVMQQVSAAGVPTGGMADPPPA
jgi:limonene-1,2-epoxide hydrolase